jgi:tetratricopeptide (TPR) repeat protein
VDAFRAEEPVGEAGIALGVALLGRDKFSWDFSSFEQRLLLFQESASILRRLGARRELAVANINMAILSHNENYAQAEPLLQESLAIYSELSDAYGIAWAYHMLGLLAMIHGRDQEAEHYCLQALEMYRDQDRPASVTFCLNTLGDIAFARQQYAVARQSYEESLVRAQELGFGEQVAMQTEALGDIALATSRYDKATRCYQQTLAETIQVGSYWRAAEMRIKLGHVALAAGQPLQAEQHYAQVLQAAVERQDTELALRILPNLAAVWVHPDYRGREEIASPERQAAELVALALYRPESREETKDRANTLLAKLKSQLTPEALAQAQERGRAHDLWATAAELLDDRRNDSRRDSHRDSHHDLGPEGNRPYG